MHRVRSSPSTSAVGRKQSGGEVIAILSGKGGVGKSVLAANLGIQLARRGRQVILLDADFGLANTDILLNLTPLADFGDLLDPCRPLEELLIDGPDGLRVLCGVSGLTRRGACHEPRPQDCAAAVQRLRRACELLLVDCAAGVSPLNVALALASDHVVLVTTPEPTALANGYATLKLICNCGFAGRAGVVVNMARSRGEAGRVAGRLAAVAGRFLGLTVEWLGHVPEDRRVSEAVRARVPPTIWSPRSVASRFSEKICDRLLAGGDAAEPGSGWWARVAGLFL